MKKIVFLVIVALVSLALFNYPNGNKLQVDGNIKEGFSFSSSSFKMEPSNYEVTVTVRNNNNEPIEFDKALVTLVTKGGNLSQKFSYPGGKVLQPGESETISFRCGTVEKGNEIVLMVAFLNNGNSIDGKVHYTAIPSIEEIPFESRESYHLTFKASDAPAQSQKIDAEDTSPSLQNTSDSLQISGVAMMMPEQGRGVNTRISFDYYVIISITNNGRNTIVFDTIKHSFDGGDIKNGYKGVSYSKDVNGWSIEPGKSIMFDFQTSGNRIYLASFIP